MRLATALCALMGLWSACSEFIQFGEKDFVGEDPKLTKILHERMTHGGMKLRPMKLPRQFYQNQKIKKSFLRNSTVETSRNSTVETNINSTVGARRNFTQDGRRWLGPRWYGIPVDRDRWYGLNLVDRAMEMMQHAVYLTQYRMRNLQEIVDKYDEDMSFRIGFIYCKLDQSIRNMRVLYTFTNKTLNDYYFVYRGVFWHVMYYSYFMKHNHDVTYIVEHLIRIHTAHVAKLQAEKKAKSGNQAQSQKSSKTEAPDESDEDDDGDEGPANGPGGGPPGPPGPPGPNGPPGGPPGPPAR